MPSTTHDHLDDKKPEKWKHEGVRVVKGDQLDGNVPSTQGMDRKAAINFARVGAEKLWAGTVTIHANAKTGATLCAPPRNQRQSHGSSGMCSLPQRRAGCLSQLRHRAH